MADVGELSLIDLPIRSGDKPETQDCLPHCQKTQESSDGVFRDFVTR